MFDPNSLILYRVRESCQILSAPCDTNKSWIRLLVPGCYACDYVRAKKYILNIGQ